MAVVSAEQNEVVRKISAWAAIITVPTFIASFYGMNFDHMPELHWHGAYPAVVALMAVAAFVLCAASSAPSGSERGVRTSPPVVRASQRAVWRA